MTDYPVSHPAAGMAGTTGPDPSWLARIDQFLAASTGRRPRTASGSESVGWPWPGELAAGVFRHLVHRVRTQARTVRFDGLTYYVADCGAIAVPTDAPHEDWAFCTSCWPR